MISPISFVAGAATWSFAEYALHRFAGHAPKQRKSDQKATLFDGDFGTEHQAHHTDTRYFTPTERKLKTAAVAAAALGTLGSLVFGPRRALSFVAGFAVTYASYEIAHRRTHTHAPRGPYSRWTRRHHLSHHFSNPGTNHGVTSPIWDLVFGTYVDHGRIRVPRRHAPPWLIDDQGRVRDEYTDTYEIAGVARVSAAAAA
jgi:hypothetical protein